MDEPILGIDLGTTFSVVAYVDENGRPRVIENAEGRLLTPSVVLIEDGGITVGERAANQAIAKESSVVRWIKRSMWDDDYRFHGLSPVDISAEILRKLKGDAEAWLGQVIHKAVITCPQYFAHPEVENTRRAGEKAGLEVPEIVREPTAAAVYYGVEHLGEGELVLIYDLGGGTFDATILKFSGGSFRPVASLGERELGGHDWTGDLLEYVARQFELRTGRDPRDEPTVHQYLYERCEVAKCDLSRLERVVIPCTINGQTEQVEVRRETFEQLTENRIQKTVECCQNVLRKASPALEWAAISKVLLVGGSTRLRRVPEALIEISGKTPIRTGEVDTMVALGAAVLAKGTVRARRAHVAQGAPARSRPGLIAVQFERTCPRNLGTRVILRVKDAARIANSVIIPYGTLIPAEKTRDDYATTSPRQLYFDVPIVEYDEIGDDVVVGTFRFQCPAEVRARRSIAVTFRYDKSGIIEVEARDVHSGQLLPKEKVKYVEPDLSRLSAPSKPRKVIFALDVSGSMAGDKLERAKQALSETAEGLIEQGSDSVSVGVVTFSSSAACLCSPTRDLTEIRSAINPIGSSGSTRMDAGIASAAEMLRDALGSSLCEIALVTDGMPDSVESALRAAKAAADAGIRISAVGIGSKDVDEAFLHRIASGVLMIESVDQLSEALPNLLMQGGGNQAATIMWGGGADG